MELKVSVKSSAIETVIYNDETKTLRLKFCRGAEYDYPNVPQQEFQNLVSAPSVGKYFNQHIKKYAVKI